MTDTHAHDLNTHGIASGVRRYILRGFSMPVFTGLMLFLPAQDFKWVWGWVVMAVYVTWHIVTIIVLQRANPGVLAERSRMQAGSKTWDMWIATFAAGVLPMATWLIGGYDYRLGWSPDIALIWRLVALGLMVLSYHVWMVWAMASNTFFSVTVRIQEERGHTVATGGPYRYVRHPGYVGAILFQLALPVLLGSLWGLIPGVAAAILYVIRTALEDRTLHAELDGYAAYAQRVPYKLIPGVW